MFERLLDRLPDLRLAEPRPLPRTARRTSSAAWNGYLSSSARHRVSATRPADAVVPASPGDRRTRPGQLASGVEHRQRGAPLGQHERGAGAEPGQLHLGKLGSDRFAAHDTHREPIVVPAGGAGLRRLLQLHIEHWGRKLAVETLDSATSDLGDEQAATTACGNAFAMVGSMSAFDSGGAQTVQGCAIPDLRALAVTPERGASTVSYAADALTISEIPTRAVRVLQDRQPRRLQACGLRLPQRGAVVPNARSFAIADARASSNSSTASGCGVAATPTSAAPSSTRPDRAGKARAGHSATSGPRPAC